MTVKRVKNMWHHQAPHDIYIRRQKSAAASSYLSAAITALLLAAVTVLIGIAAIGDTVESYFVEQPIINIMIPPQELR